MVTSTWFCFADEVMHEQIIAKISRGKSESLEDKEATVAACMIKRPWIGHRSG